MFGGPWRFPNPQVPMNTLTSGIRMPPPILSRNFHQTWVVRPMGNSGVTLTEEDAKTIADFTVHVFHVYSNNMMYSSDQKIRTNLRLLKEIFRLHGLIFCPRDEEDDSSGDEVHVDAVAADRVEKDAVQGNPAQENQADTDEVDGDVNVDAEDDVDKDKAEVDEEVKDENDKVDDRNEPTPSTSAGSAGTSSNSMDSSNAGVRDELPKDTEEPISDEETHDAPIPIPSPAPATSFQLANTSEEGRGRKRRRSLPPPRAKSSRKSTQRSKSPPITTTTTRGKSPSPSRARASRSRSKRQGKSKESSPAPASANSRRSQSVPAAENPYSRSHIYEAAQNAQRPKIRKRSGKPLDPIPGFSRIRIQAPNPVAVRNPIAPPAPAINDEEEDNTRKSKRIKSRKNGSPPFGKDFFAKMDEALPKKQRLL